LAETRKAIEASNERWSESDIQRLTGVLLLSQRKIAESEGCFQRAVPIARQQQQSL
jgi:hypothetical protein